MVQVGGIRAGRVQDVELDDSKVLVTFEVDHGVEFGEDSKAPRRGAQPARREVPQPGPRRSRTARPGHADPGRADLGGVRHRRRLRRPHRDHRADRHRPARRRRSTSSPTRSTSPRPRSRPASRGSPGSRSRWPRATRRSSTCSGSSRDVSALLADRSDDLVDLMQNSSLVFEEVERRKAAIHRLLVNARDPGGPAARGRHRQPGPDRARAERGRRPAQPPQLQGEGAQGDPQRPRSLRVDPGQHHRHRPVVRRLRRQPGRHPHGRVPARASGP